MHIKQHTHGMLLPTAVCLAGAIGFLLYCRAGGEAQVSLLLDAIANNHAFVQQALAIETGVSPAWQPAHQQDDYVTSVTVPTVTEKAPQWMPTVAESAFPASTTPTLVVPTIHTIEINNETNLAVDPVQALTQPPSFTLTDDAPQVVIYHTHTTEAYTPDGADNYVPLSQERTLDNTQNVVQVGNILTETLQSYGIEVLHITDTFDYPSYEGSYAASQQAIEQVVADNPSVVCTIDLHRDAVYDDDGMPINRSVLVDGASLSPMMLVVGTNDSGLAHDDWRENFNFACNLQNTLMTLSPDIMRPLNLRRQRFNQHVTTASLILECGWSGNTLAQAEGSVKIFGEGLASVLVA